MAAALLATVLLLLATVLLLLAIALLLSFRKTPPTQFLGPFWDFTSIFVCLQHLFVRLYYRKVLIWFLSRFGRTFSFESGYRRRSPYLTSPAYSQ